MIIDIEKANELWPETCHGRWMSEDYVPSLVSVIIPTYNRAQLLVEAMDSVWAQTYRPIELLVVDDGSTDNTRALVPEWANKSEGDDEFELRYFYQENNGAPAARNLGLIDSRGGFIQFFDSDDLLHPEKLTRQVAALENNPKLDFVHSGTAKFEDKPDWNSKAYCGRRSERLLPDFITKLLWCVASGVYRTRACVANGPWHEGLVQEQDWELNKKGYPLRKIVQIMARVGFFVDRTYRVRQFPRQRMFVLRKNHIRVHDDDERQR